MKKSTTLILILALLLIAFITNPSKEKHLQNGLEIAFDNSNEKNDYGVVENLISKFEKEKLITKINVKNYYLCSISSLHIGDNDDISLGLGLFGQIIPLSNFDQYIQQKPKEELIVPQVNKEKKIQDSKELKENSKETEDALNRLINGPDNDN